MNLDDVLAENGEAERFASVTSCSLERARIGTGFPCPPGHDCAYVKARSELVPAASRLAFERLKKLSPEDDQATGRNAKFTRAFAMEMERLAAPLLKNGTSTAPCQCALAAFSRRSLKPHRSEAESML